MWNRNGGLLRFQRRECPPLAQRRSANQQQAQQRQGVFPARFAMAADTGGMSAHFTPPDTISNSKITNNLRSIRARSAFNEVGIAYGFQSDCGRQRIWIPVGKLLAANGLHMQ
jgi:hypothetical protein